MALVLFNTLSRTKEPFVPLHAPKVGFYSCGPTVYNYAHIGNLRSYVFADTLKRVLRYDKYDVTHVMNITDVGHLTSDADEGEDKMEKGARREGKTVWDIAAFYTERFKKDLAALNIGEPDIWCKATDHIAEQIAQVQALEKKGYTYTTSDGVYFDTTKLADYGKLARLDLEQLEAGARVEIGDKKNKTDFALWKFSPKDGRRQMEWDSPWGVGFPGWHIECSAMSDKYLGGETHTFDIHTGGIDHIPVHHTNEIAQAEAAFGKKPWVKYWLHGEFLVIEQGKMAKSGENFLTLQSVMDKGYDPLDYRYLCLSAHYRQQLKFSWEALDTAKASRQRLKNIVEELQAQAARTSATTAHGVSDAAKNHASAGGDVPSGKEPHHHAEHAKSEQGVAARDKYEGDFQAAIDDDLNMPQALAVLWNALRDNELRAQEKLALAEKFDHVLGLRLTEKEAIAVPAEIQALAQEREDARKAKDWAASDRLRDAIKAKGWQVLDGKDGYKLKPN